MNCMGIGEEKQHNHKDGFRQEIEKSTLSDRDTFFNWFNESGGDSNFVFWPSVYVFLKSRTEKFVCF